MFADSHVHPLMKYIHGERDNLWDSYNVTPNPIAIVNKVVGIPSFSQSDFRRLCKGGFEVVFCALHPPEQQIMFTKVGESPLENLVEKIAAQVISIPKDKIDEYQDPRYDHWKQLNKERELIQLNPNPVKKIRVGISLKRTECRLQLVNSFTELESIIDENKREKYKHTIAVILTIEGLHALGTGHIRFFDKDNNFNVNEDTFLQRVDNIKGITNDNQGWEFSPIVINLTHAFQNGSHYHPEGICGHAQALSGAFHTLFRYSEPFGPIHGPKWTVALNKPMTDFCRKVIKRMLNLDENPQGKRIIPDIKHMSTATRRNYYAIIDPVNENLDPEHRIPVIMSHAAVNGKPSYDENDFNPEDLEKEYADSADFNKWSINLYDNEIIKIHETYGLIGLIFDERILAGGKKLKYLKERKKGQSSPDNPFNDVNPDEVYTKLLVDQITYIVQLIYSQPTGVDPVHIWERICIGSDFDGQINPIDDYKKATDFKEFKKELTDMLSKPAYSNLFDQITVEIAVDNICFNNIMEFLRRNF